MNHPPTESAPSRPRRFLILSVTAGSGHIRAAAALEEAVRLKYPDAVIENLDVLSFTDPIYRAAYNTGYIQLVNRAPSLYAAVYKSSDRVIDSRIMRKLEKFYDWMRFAQFKRTIRAFAPDIVLSTHFLPAQIFATWKHSERQFLSGVVVTDFDAHAFWVQPVMDRTFVASEELREVMHSRGVTREKVVVSGIPVHATFSGAHPRAALRRRLGLRHRTPTVLIMGGGAGMGTMAETVKIAFAAGPVQVLAVAGRNEELLKKLRRMRAPSGSNLHPFGFTSEIDALMTVSDLVITKSGGLTTSECLAMHLPMIVTDPIPGQEERNCDYLLEAGAAVRANGPASLQYKLRQLLHSPKRLAQMRRAAKAVARPHAARDIVEEMVRLHDAT